MRSDRDTKHQCGQVQKETLPAYSNALGTRYEYVSQADMTHTQATTKWKTRDHLLEIGETRMTQTTVSEKRSIGGNASCRR